MIDFADIILKSIREDVDWVGRYGGEEFLLVLKETNLEDAFIIAEKIRKLVNKTVFNYDNKKIDITASFGVHTCQGEEINIEDLISQVDGKLYEDKEGGRNKTIADIENYNFPNKKTKRRLTVNNNVIGINENIKI